MPGRASGKGGMAATLGQDGGAALRPLTVDFHESGFAATLAREDAFTQAQGFWFQLSGQDRQQAKVDTGPRNPQVLDRYSYVLNNPLRYTDPSGHCRARSGCSDGLDDLGDPDYQKDPDLRSYMVADDAEPQEIAFADMLFARGYDVEVRGTNAAGPDLRIDGRYWELKTIFTPTQNAVENALRGANKQPGVDRVIIDGSGLYGGSMLDYDVAQAALDSRLRNGGIGQLVEIRILTGDGRWIIWRRPGF